MKRLIVCAVLAFTLTACPGKRPVVTTPPARCASLIPQSWLDGIEAAPVPDTTQMEMLDALKAWAAAYVAQGGQLAKANGRTVDAITIIRQCEQLMNEARADRQ